MAGVTGMLWWCLLLGAILGVMVRAFRWPGARYPLAVAVVAGFLVSPAVVERGLLGVISNMIVYIEAGTAVFVLMRLLRAPNRFTPEPLLVVE